MGGSQIMKSTGSFHNLFWQLWLSVMRIAIGLHSSA